MAKSTGRPERVRALLAKDCLTFAEIGRRVGLSRERVRQLALRYGAARGHERQKQCRIARWQTAPYWAGRPGGRVIKQLEKRGIPYQILMRAGDPRRPSWRRLRINGWLCEVRKASPRHMAGNDYWQLVRPHAESDFCVYECGPHYLVVPRRAFPKHTTIVAVGRKLPESGRGVTHSHRHDWQDYLEGWGALKSRRRGGTRA